MKNYLILILALIFCSQLSVAQSYFQQEVNFKIDVKLDDINHSLSAYETIEYINNSLDTLNNLYFHI